MIKPFDENLLQYSSGQLGSYAQFKKLEEIGTLKQKFVIVGFPDDRGVVLNSGHPGARKGPLFFREQFYRLHVAQNDSSLAENLVDIGDVDVLPPTSLAKSHENLSKVVEQCLLKDAEQVFVIGGGHDLSYPSYEGHCLGGNQDEIKIVNFDAHFDLRECEHGQLTSGTPFYRCIESPVTKKYLKCGKALLEVGIQRPYNSEKLFRYASATGVKHLLFSDYAEWLDERAMKVIDVEQHVQAFMGVSENMHLSIDLDVFSANTALGTSAATPFAPDAHTLFKLLFSVAPFARVVDVAELCPPRDYNAQTSRLAAGVVWRVMKLRGQRNSSK